MKIKAALIGVIIMGGLCVACGSSGTSAAVDGSDDGAAGQIGTAGAGGTTSTFDGGADAADSAADAADVGADAADSAADAADVGADAADSAADAADVGANATDGGGAEGATDGAGADGADDGTSRDACAVAPTASVAWTIGTSTGAPITCAQAGATTVDLLMNVTLSAFSCDAGSGTTPALPPGEYTQRMLLTDAQGVVLVDGDLSVVTIPSCGATNLGNVRFVVSAH